MQVYMLGGGHRTLSTCSLASLASVEISETLSQTSGGDKQQARLSSDLQTHRPAAHIHTPFPRAPLMMTE